MPLAAAIIGAGALSAGGAIYGANLQNRAANNAARQAAEAATQNRALQQYMFQQAQANQQPYMSAGRDALFRLQDLLGMGQSSWDEQVANPAYTGARRSRAGGGNVPTGQQVPQFLTVHHERNVQTPAEIMSQDPSYQWRLQQGQQALERSALARGGIYNGNFAAALQNYGQGQASQEYGNVYNRLAAMAGLGQSAAAGVGNAGMQVATNIGQQNTNAANAAGAYGVQAANNSANMYGSLANTGNQMINNLYYAYGGRMV